jgi:hypothetical protein
MTRKVIARRMEEGPSPEADALPDRLIVARSAIARWVAN